jgi:flagellin
MSVIINNNYAATAASNNLSVANESLQRSLNRLSSGSRIVSPADDAGGLAVSMKLSAAAKRSGAAVAGVTNMSSYLQQQDGVLKVAGKVLERIGELKALYIDPTKNTSDQANYDAEFSTLKSQLTDLASEKFNGVSLFGTAGLAATRPRTVRPRWPSTART